MKQLGYQTRSTNIYQTIHRQEDKANLFKKKYSNENEMLYLEAMSNGSVLNWDETTWSLYLRQFAGVPFSDLKAELCSCIRQKLISFSIHKCIYIYMYIYALIDIGMLKIDRQALNLCSEHFDRVRWVCLMVKYSDVCVL